MLGLHFWARTFSSGKLGLLLLAVHGVLLAAASLVAKHGLEAHGLSGCHALTSAGPRCVESSRIRDQPVALVSPALAGGFFSTEPPGKSSLALDMQKPLTVFNFPSYSVLFES